MADDIQSQPAAETGAVGAAEGESKNAALGRPRWTNRYLLAAIAIMLAILALTGLGIRAAYVQNKETQKRIEIEDRLTHLKTAMRRHHHLLSIQNAPGLMRYGAGETWAQSVLGPPYEEKRDGSGQRTYLWAGNGVLLIAKFRNGKCEDYSFLDEYDVELEFRKHLPSEKDQ